MPKRITRINKAPATIAAVVQRKWAAKQLAAITFLANPRGGTQRELAAELKVTEQTITDWKKLAGFMEDVHRVAAVYFLEADLQVDRANLRDAVMNPTKHPDVAASILKARELYYKRRGLLIDKHEVGGIGGGPVESIMRIDADKAIGIARHILDTVGAGK